ncbi:MAG: MFS transporter [Eubacteriales bacterium]|nr:MFS transporter [Eubacteriales bacterium]
MYKLAQRLHIHYAWINLVALCLMMAGTIGLFVNCNGVLFNAILKDLGFKSGDLSIFYSVRQITAAFTVLVTVKLYLKGWGHKLVAGLAALLAVSVGAYSLCNQVWHWYILGFFVGIGQSSFHAIVPLVINRWFHKNNGFAIGLAMAASGVGGMLANPLISKLILAIGWRATSLCVMAAGLLIVVPSSLFILKDDPDVMGIIPYGSDDKEKAVASSTNTTTKKSTETISIPKYFFFLCMFYAVCGGSSMGHTNQVALFTQSLGYDLTISGYMTSFMMAGNLIGKVVVGMLADRLGVFKAMYISLVVVFCCFVCFLTFTDFLPGLLLGSACLGVAYAVYSMPSLLCLKVFGPEKYKHVLAKVSAAYAMSNAIFSTSIGFLYDFFNSFAPSFVICGIFTAGQFALVLLIALRLKKLHSQVPVEA